MIRDVPFSGVFYPIYNLFKKELVLVYDHKNKDRIETSAERVKKLATISSIASFSANIVSCALTHPIDLIRTRVLF